MPELPEVETVRRGLAPVFEGARILRADVNRPDLRWPMPADLSERLAGRHVRSLRRRSKYILADLDSDETLLLHLGMSGRILVSAQSARREVQGSYVFEHAAAQKHDHVVIHLACGARITFNDPRRFGMVDLMPTADAATHRLLAGLGPEPFGNEFDASYLIARLRGRRTSIKAALLDQHVVAGLGNIYVCEVLHRAGISPRRLACRIAQARLASLVGLIRIVLAEAIDAGGSSLRDYRQTDGDLGYFQHQFRVYGREGGKCLTRDCTGIIRRVVQSGRSSFYCPICQR